MITNAFQSTGSLESPPGTTIFESTGRLTYPRVSPDGNSIALCHNPGVSDTRGQILVVDGRQPAEAQTAIRIEISRFSSGP